MRRREENSCVVESGSIMGCLPIKRSVIPLEGDSEISEIMDKYQFTDKEIQKFWVMFNRTDKE